MTTYLSMNGTSDTLVTPSFTFTQIVMDVNVVRGYTTLQQRLWSLPLGANFLMRNTNSTDNYSSGVSSVLVNGVAVTNNTQFIPVNSRCTITSNSTNTNKTYIFNSNGNTAYTQGNIYDIKFYNGATLVAHYDMSTGTVQDQSGNGNHATLTGGTWLNDGAGGTGTNASITSVIANTTSSVLAPIVTAQQQVSVSSVIANVNADALTPTISTSASVSANIECIVTNDSASGISPVTTTQKQISVSSVIANTIADGIAPSFSSSGNTNIIGNVAISNVNAINPTISTNSNITSAVSSATSTGLSPQVGSFTNISINSVISNASTSVNNPNVATTKNVNLNASTSNTTAIAFIPNIGSSQSTNIASVIASLVVGVMNPNVSTSKSINVQSFVANVNADTNKPTIERDMVLSVNASQAQASGIVVYSGKKYTQIVPIDVDIHRKEIIVANIHRKDTIEIKI